MQRDGNKLPWEEIVSEWRKSTEWLCFVDDKRIAWNYSFVDVSCRWVFVALRKNRLRRKEIDSYHRQLFLILMID